MRTYLLLWFNSDGTKSSEVAERLTSMGFRAVHGNYDYEYNWGNKKVALEDTIRLGDQVHATLRGCNVLFKLESA